MQPAIDRQEPPALAISSEKVCYIIALAREFDVKEEVSEPDPGSNAVDDGMIAVLEDHDDDPVEEELTSFIRALSVDEQVDLVTLAWLGRGDGGVEEWNDLRQEARRAHNARTAAYLLGMPLLADYLAGGLEQCGRSCEDYEVG
ncbi:MAG: DUF3775 domain-containing protein [Bauldia sp.]